MKRAFSIGTLLLAVTALLTLVLVATYSFDAFRAFQGREQARRVPRIVDISADLFLGTTTLRVERGQVNAALLTQDAVTAQTQSDIAALRMRSSEVLDSALAKLATVQFEGIHGLLDQVDRTRGAVADLRGIADAAALQPKSARPPSLSAKWIAAVNDVVNAIEDLSRALESELSRSDGFIADMTRIKQIVWSVRSNSGDERLRVREAMTRGEPLSDAKREELTRLAGRIEGAWTLVREEARLPHTPSELKNAVEAVDQLYFGEFRPIQDSIVQDLLAGRFVYVSPHDYLELARPSREAIVRVSEAAFDLAGAHALELADAAESDFYTAFFLTGLFLAVGLFTGVCVFMRIVRPIAQITNSMNLVADGDLSLEIPFQQRSDEIGSLSRALRVFRDTAIERQRLEVANMAAESANRTKSEFMANMSHELRTPLNAIIGFSEIIDSQMFGPIGNRYHEYAGNILSSGKHLLSLINEVLDLAKLEAGQLELLEEDIDLVDLVTTSISFVETQARKSRIDLSHVVDVRVRTIRGDKRRLRQAVVNLLSNAVKFTPEGGSVRLGCETTSFGVSIVVSDTGVGIDPRDVPKALEPFGQIDSTISRKYEGTGLGLPLAKHLVKLHGGTLTIESQINAGTTVTITLPPSRIIPLAQRELHQAG